MAGLVEGDAPETLWRNRWTASCSAFSPRLWRMSADGEPASRFRSFYRSVFVLCAHCRAIYSCCACIAQYPRRGSRGLCCCRVKAREELCENRRNYREGERVWRVLRWYGERRKRSAFRVEKTARMYESRFLLRPMGTSKDNQQHVAGLSWPLSRSSNPRKMCVYLMIHHRPWTREASRVNL